MAGILERVYVNAPHWLQTAMVTGFNLRNYTLRRGGDYERWKAFYGEWERRPIDEIRAKQSEMLVEFLRYVAANSPFYRKRWAGIDIEGIRSPRDLTRLPIVDKEDLRRNLDEIVTLPKWRAQGSVTGGSTGASLKVYYGPEDTQMRYGALDNFRERYGYGLGKRTAWFSGKSLLGARDIRQHRYWKTDVFHHIRYYSTFHITPETAPHYIADLNAWAPQVINAFATNVYEIARLSQSLDCPITFSPEVIFVTAETLVPEYRKVIESVFGTKVRDQYASAEGAPFAFECPHGRWHDHLLTGVIEIVDEDLQPADSGEILVTSFSTRGTPLVRYRIGDVMSRSGGTCDCGDQNPVIDSIEGRTMDYIYSPERGKINLGNLSNSVKYVGGVTHFQVEQNEPDAIIVRVVRDGTYTAVDEQQLMANFRDRFGEKLAIELQYVAAIPRTVGGKFKFIINNLE